MRNILFIGWLELLFVSYNPEKVPLQQNFVILGFNRPSPPAIQTLYVGHVGLCPCE